MRPGLCHGDASPWNALAGPNNRWKLIDPRGMQGEPEYDAAVMAYKVGCLLPDPGAQSKIANAAQLDQGRLTAWATIVGAARV
ncbi:hypothetical protein GCM10027445_31430 [Amycolatopsis endophytica]